MTTPKEPWCKFKIDSFEGQCSIVASDENGDEMMLTNWHAKKNAAIAELMEGCLDLLNRHGLISTMEGIVLSAKIKALKGSI